MDQVQNRKRGYTESVIKKVGKYELVKEIGSGSFARVYKARSVEDDQYYAIKMIKKQDLNDSQMDQIEKEIEVLQALDNRYIIKLLDFKKTANNWYLVFEYCSQGDLVNYIKKNFKGILPEEHARKIMRQLSEAFKELKKLSIVHRDLKLANILITADFDVKLADFGFARFQGQNELLMTYCGTPITMAPEVLEKGRNYGEKVDIWSIGVMIYQMLYGRPPFLPPQDKASIDSLFEAVVQGKLKFDPNVKVSEEAKDLMSKMLVVDPERRLSFQDFFNHKWILPDAPSTEEQRQQEQNDDQVRSLLKSAYQVTPRQQGQSGGGTGSFDLSPTSPHPLNKPQQQQQSSQQPAQGPKPQDSTSQQQQQQQEEPPRQKKGSQDLPEFNKYQLSDVIDENPLDQFKKEQFSAFVAHQSYRLITQSYEEQIQRLTKLKLLMEKLNSQFTKQELLAKNNAPINQLLVYGSVVTLQFLKLLLENQVQLISRESLILRLEIPSPAREGLLDLFRWFFEITTSNLELFDKSSPDFKSLHVETLLYRTIIDERQREQKTDEAQLTLFLSDEKEICKNRYLLCIELCDLMARLRQHQYLRVLTVSQKNAQDSNHIAKKCGYNSQSIFNQYQNISESQDQSPDYPSKLADHVQIDEFKIGYNSSKSNQESLTSLEDIKLLKELWEDLYKTKMFKD